MRRLLRRRLNDHSLDATRPRGKWFDSGVGRADPVLLHELAEVLAIDVCLTRRVTDVEGVLLQ